MKYAGVGSRKTPPFILATMTKIGACLARGGHALRSGGARGADQAFEDGARSAYGIREIFLARNARPEWFEHAAMHHPNWYAVEPYAKSLHARNSAIMLGPSLNDPVDFVVCWTPGARVTGGTGQALRIAAAYGIPVHNLAEPMTLEKWLQYVG